MDKEDKPKRPTEELNIVTALGVTTSMEFSEDYAVIQFFDKSKLVKQRKIFLKSEEPKDLKEIGKAFGMNIPHCFYLGCKYCKDFVNIVQAYSVTPGGIKDCAMTVTFYGNK